MVVRVREEGKEGGEEEKKVGDWRTEKSINGMR